MRKSNYLAAAMAFAAIVGCQKELAPVAGIEQAGDAGLDQRPVLASSELTFGGVETRAEAGNASGIGWVWEAGDQVGAVLVDEVISESVKGYVGSVCAEWSYSEYVAKEQKQIGEKKFFFTDTYTAEYNANGVNVKHTGEAFYKINDSYIYSNYPYTTEGGNTFHTPATLVEGHYMFYAPYNAGNGTREALVATLPMEQTVGKNGNEAVDAFFKGNDPVILALNYLSAEETSTVKSSLGHIFAYPQFKIKNEFNGYLFDGDVYTDKVTYLSNANEAKTYTMTVKQIELYTKAESENPLAWKRTITPSKLADAADWAGGTSYVTTATDKVAVPVEGVDYDFGEDDEYASFQGGMIDNQEKGAHRIVVTLNKTLKHGEEFPFNVVMPAATYTGDNALYARVLVTIGEKDYYIWGTNTSDKLVTEATTAAMKGYVKANSTQLNKGADYLFVDRHNRGSEDLTLVRGQRWPNAEVNKDNTLKTFKGELLTIELTGGLSQIAVAAATEETETKVGIKDNKDMLEFLNEAHYGGTIQEVSEPVTDPENNHTDFYLEENNEVIIDAELVKELSNRIGANGLFTLTTNLPIANDVVVAMKDATTYTFTAGTVSYEIHYASEDAFGKTANALIAGINVIENEADDVKVATGKSNAVVFLNGNSTVKTPAGISGIVVAESKELTVNASADVTAWVVAPTVILQKGNLVNDLNKLNTVENNNLLTVVGKATTVTYKRNGFGTEAIPAATQVNQVTITAAGTNVTLPVETETFDYFKNLTDVTVIFDEKISALESEAASVVVPDNIIAVNGTTTSWNTTDQVSGTTVSFAKNATYTVSAGNGVSFTNRN